MVFWLLPGRKIAQFILFAICHLLIPYNLFVFLRGTITQSHKEIWMILGPKILSDFEADLI